MSKIFLRRSLLYVPGNSLKMMNKALAMEVDSIIFDLEDAVSFSEKIQARKNISDFINYAKESDKEIIVRINSVDTYLGMMDLIELTPKAPHTIIIPKASMKSLVTADVMISSIEVELGWKKNTVKLIPLIETTDGIINVNNMLNATQRIVGVHLGGEDLTNELEVPRTKTGEELFFARSQVIYAAKSLNIDAIDCPYVDFKDQAGLSSDCRRAKSLGMTGKVCIHPSQVETVNNEFSPTKEEVNYSIKVVNAYKESIAQGRGALSVDGKMVDLPIVLKAQKVIEKVENSGLVNYENNTEEELQ